MKKIITILTIVVVLIVLCTACEPTVDDRGKGVLHTLGEYTIALYEICEEDRTGRLGFAYVTKYAPWEVEVLGFETSPEFFATVEEAIRFDEYTVKMKMKGGRKKICVCLQ